MGTNFVWSCNNKKDLNKVGPLHGKFSLKLFLSVCLDRIYPREHFKEKYAVNEVHYTTDVSTVSL